jgi:hypothetical protein
MGMIGNSLAQGLISGANIQDGTVDTPDLKDSAVSTAKIADSAITTAKIADANVTTAKVADSAVTAAKLASTAVTDKLGYTPANKAGDTFTGAVTANQFKNTYTTVLNDYRTTSPASDTIILQGASNDRDCWIYRDPAGGVNNWGIYHRNIDTSVGGVPGNSLVFVGANAAAGYIGLENKVWGIGSNLVPVYSGGTVSGSPEAAANLLWFPAWYSLTQRCTYDRGWNNNPSITVLNDTTNGGQADFRIHGASGISGADFSVNLVVDGSISQLSDERTKTEIQDIQNALATVLQLQGKTFKHINSQLEVQSHTSMAGGRRFGFIAQQIKDVIPETVRQFEGEVTVPNENGYAEEFSVDYASIVALLTEAIKEQQAQIGALTQRIAALENN